MQEPGRHYIEGAAHHKAHPGAHQHPLDTDPDQRAAGGQLLCLRTGEPGGWQGRVPRQATIPWTGQPCHHHLQGSAHYPGKAGQQQQRDLSNFLFVLFFRFQDRLRTHLFTLSSKIVLYIPGVPMLLSV